MTQLTQNPTHPQPVLAAERPFSSLRFDWMVTISAIWFIFGLYLDGWAHNNIGGLESFFTPWHAVFYSGFAVVTAVHGQQSLEAITLKNTVTGEEETLPAAAMFIFIGAVPHTAMVAKVVTCNSAGFILTGPDLMKDGRPPAGWTLRRDPYLLETSVPGIFAAGDVRQNAVRRVASAVGQGANVVSFVHQYLRTV